MKNSSLIKALQEIGIVDDLPLFDEGELLAALPKMQKPIMSEQVEADALDALSQYQNKDKWAKWGMDILRKQGSAILLEGPPGTGKTTIARWMASKIKKGFKSIAAADFAASEPGQSERNLREIFDEARKERKNVTIFMDECDHLLMNRKHIGEAGKTWQLGSMEELMVQINTYPGLMIAATNHPENLDPALSDRFLAIVRVDIPDFLMRSKLWSVKIPRTFPFQPSPLQIKELAKPVLTGRQIENVIVGVASNAIRRGMKPNMKMFHVLIERELSKKLE